MKKIALMCDSSADITKEQAKELDIHVIRMPISMNGKEFIEEETIFDKDIIQGPWRCCRPGGWSPPQTGGAAPRLLPEPGPSGPPDRPPPPRLSLIHIFTARRAAKSRRATDRK